MDHQQRLQSALTDEEPFSIGETIIPTGSAVSVQLPLPRLYTRSELTMPVRVVRGRKPGPRLLVCAALHGDEINGTEVVRRLLKIRGLRKLRGTLIAVPVINIYGLVSGSRYLPDRRDLNRTFPGSESGSLTSRLAKLVLDELASKATHVIDIHTGSVHRPNLPQVRTTLDHEASASLARAFGAPVVLNARLREGSLRKSVIEKGSPAIVYETGEALRMDEMGIRVGVRGIISVMRELEMLRSSSRGRSQKPFIARGSTWVRASMSGVFQSRCRLGEAVTTGEVLGTISDPLGDEEVEVRSTSEGVVIGRLNLPLVYQGDALLHIAQFKAPDKVASGVKEFEAALEEDPDPI